MNQFGNPKMTKNKKNEDSDRRRWPRLNPGDIPFLKRVEFNQGSKIEIVNMFRNHASWSDKIVGIVNTLEKRSELVCAAVSKVVVVVVAVTVVVVIEIIPEEEVPPFIK